MPRIMYTIHTFLVFSSYLNVKCHYSIKCACTILPGDLMWYKDIVLPVKEIPNGIPFTGKMVSLYWIRSAFLDPYFPIIGNTLTYGIEINIGYWLHLWLIRLVVSQITKFMGPTWCPPGSCRPQMGPMQAPRSLLSGVLDALLWNVPSKEPPGTQRTYHALQIFAAYFNVISLFKY